MSNYYGKIRNKKIGRSQNPYDRPGSGRNFDDTGGRSTQGHSHNNTDHLGQGVYAPVPNELNSTNESSLRNNKNFVNRVKKSVTGLFGRSWWPDWLKGWEGSPDDLPEHAPPPMPHTLSTSQEKIVTVHPPGESFIFSKGTTDGSNPFKQIYPEEGESPCSENSQPKYNDTLLRNTGSEDRTFDEPSCSGEPPPLFFCGTSEQPLVASTPAMSPHFCKPKRINSDPRDLPADLSLRLNRLSQTINGPLQEIEEEEALDVSIDNNVSESMLNRKRDRRNLDQLNGNESSLYTSALEESTSRPTKKPRISSIAHGASLTPDTSFENSSYSIFYPGKISYGGASNYRRAKLSQTRSPTPNKVILRSSPAPSSNSSTDGGLSQAAQRILSCLDSLSTPLTEAKRIQVNHRDHIGHSLDRTRESPHGSPLSNFYKHRPRLRAGLGPPSTKLTTPNKLTLKDNLSSSFIMNQSRIDSDNSATEYATPTYIGPPDALQCRLGEGMGAPASSPYFTCSVGNVPPRARPSISKSSHSPDDRSKMGRLKSFSTLSENEQLPQPQAPSVTLQMSTMPRINLNIDPIRNTGTGINPSNMFDTGTLLSGSSTVVTNVYTVNTASNFNFCGSTNQEKFSCKTTSSSSLKSRSSVQMPSPFTSGNFEFSSPLVVELESSRNDDMDRPTNLTETPFTFSLPLEEANTLAKNLFEPSQSSREDALKKKLAGWASQTSIQSEQSSGLTSVVSKSNDTQSLTNTTATSNGNSWGAAFLPSKGSWECEACMVRNKESDNSCVSCTTPKPMSKTSKTTTVPSVNSTASMFSGGDFGSKFMPTPGEWSCETCLLQNKATADKCVSCETAKKTSNNASNQGFGSQFAPKAGEWECKTCMLRNKPEETKCMSCQTAKEGSSGQTTAKESGFGAQFMAKAGEWECEACMLKNKAEVSKCASCETLRKGGFGAKFMPGKGEWECEMCLLRNKSETSKCISCETPKKGVAADTTSSGFGSGGFKFGIDSNANNTSKFSFGLKPMEASTNSSATAGFKFGMESMVPNSTSTFSFGQTSSTSSTTSVTTSSSLVKFGFGSTGTVETSSEPVLPKYGETVSNPLLKNPSTVSTSSIASIPPFSFGSDTSVSSQSTASVIGLPTFSFGGSSESKIKSKLPMDNIGPLSTDDSTVISNVASIITNGPSTEGSEKVSTSTSIVDTNVKKRAFSFGNPDTNTNQLFDQVKSTTSSPFSFKPTEQLELSSKTSVIPPNNMFTFGKDTEKSNISLEKLDTPVTKPSPFTFGNKEPEKSASLFSFGAEKGRPTESKSFSFGVKDSTNTPKDANKPLFAFGKPDTEKKGFSFEKNDSATKPMFAFGQKDATENKNLFAFGQKENEKPPPPSYPGPPADKQKDSPFSFANTNDAAPKSNFSFGQDKAKVGGDNPVFSFGGQKKGSEEAPSNLFQFASKPATAEPFVFGNKGATEQDPKPFVFGKPAPTVSFGEKTTETPSLFGNSGGFPSSTAFGSQTPAFGTPQSEAAPASLFSFGSEKNADKSTSGGGFGFGSAKSSINFSATNNQSSFQFGKTSSATNSATLNPFGAAIGANPFNSPAPLSSGTEQRVVKKAYRRNKK